MTDIRNIERNMEIDISGREDIMMATVGNVNEETVRKYIQEQEENDKIEDGRK